MKHLKKFLSYRENALSCENVSLEALAAEYGTPLFVYSADALRVNFRRIAKAFAAAKPLVAYSVKANSNAAILRVLAREGAGFDIVSGNELERVRRAGVPGDRIIFAGVGKTEAEMRAALRAGVREFNLESPAEAERLDAVARAMKTVAPVALRINPDVDPKTHKFISTGKKENKFGMSLDAARAMVRRIGELPGLRLEGLHAHIGSQILQEGPHAEAVGVVDAFIESLVADGVGLKTLNFGGGFGINYRPEDKPLDLRPVAKVVVGLAKKHGLELILEPGRSIVGPAGVFLTRVEYIKQGTGRTFAIVDGAMTEMIRPALYDAFHEILPISKPVRRAAHAAVDVVGPVCESGDFLALQRDMPVPEAGELLAALDAGAYCSAMSSNYNSRLRPAEILVDGDQAYLIRKREKLADLIRHEVVPDHLAD